MNTEPIDARPRTTKELCSYYCISFKTFKKMLRRAGLGALADRKGNGIYYYKIDEIHQIMAVFGGGQAEMNL